MSQMRTSFLLTRPEDSVAIALQLPRGPLARFKHIAHTHKMPLARLIKWAMQSVELPESAALVEGYSDLVRYPIRVPRRQYAEWLYLATLQGITISQWIFAALSLNQALLDQADAALLSEPALPELPTTILAIPDQDI